MLPDGTLIAADNRGFIRSYSTKGQVATVAGIIATPGPGPAGPYIEGVPPTQVNAGRPISLAAARDGTWYFTDGFRDYLHQVTPDGISTLLAGGGSTNSARATGAAPRAIGLSVIGGVAVGPDGVYVRHASPPAVWRDRHPPTNGRHRPR